MKIHRAAFVTCVSLVVFVLAAEARAARFCRPDSSTLCYLAGELDPEFVSEESPDPGAMWTEVGTSYSLGAQAMAVQPDGKILSFGSASFGDGVHELVLVRYEADGTLDETFAVGGIALTDLGAVHARGEAMALQQDGKIVGAGALAYSPSSTVLVRYGIDGVLDPTFGDGGTVVSEVASREYQAVAIEPDGDIVAAGRNGASFLVERYTAAGVLDPSFGTLGTVTTNLGGSHGFGARALVIQPDGKLVAGGATQNGTYLGCALVRYESDGSLDESFGEAGVVRVAQESGEVCFIEALALTAGGKIIASGNHTSLGTPEAKRFFRLMQFDTDGSIDGDFGKRGVVDTIVYRSYLTSATITSRTLAVQPDGKILEGGVLGGNYMAVVRHRPDGRLDRHFRSEIGRRRGVSIIARGGPYRSSGALDGAQGLATLPDGRIVVAGNIGGDFGVARLLGSACALDLTTNAFTCE